VQVMTSTDADAHLFSDHRGEGIRFQRLLRGDADAPGNFEWSIVHVAEEYRTPRHRHNFSQIHYVLEGFHEWSPTVSMPEGSVTYSPEGTFYGPQRGHGAVVLLLQFGEASGSGFTSYDRLADASKRLAESPDGRFEDGIWRYRDGDGKQHNQDGYEAIWETIHGRGIEYAKPRYETPVTIYPDAFDWTPTAEAGIERKHLGAFSERETTVGFLRYADGAVHRVDGVRAPELHFVVDGSLRVGNRTVDRRTALSFDPTDDQTLAALEPTTVFVIRLPWFE
jgi:hypothetical protein